MAQLLFTFVTNDPNSDECARISFLNSLEFVLPKALVAESLPWLLIKAEVDTLFCNSTPLYAGLFGETGSVLTVDCVSDPAAQFTEPYVHFCTSLTGVKGSSMLRRGPWPEFARLCLTLACTL